MHPQIAKEKSEKCPICFMDLVPLPYEENIKFLKIWNCVMHPDIVQSAPGTCSICGMELSEIEPQQWGTSKREHFLLTETMVKKSKIWSKPVEEKIVQGKLILMVPESALLFQPKNTKRAILFLKILNFPAVWICEIHPQKLDNATRECKICSQHLKKIDAYYTIEKRSILLGEKQEKWYEVRAGLKRKSEVIIKSKERVSQIFKLLSLENEFNETNISAQETQQNQYFIIFLKQLIPVYNNYFSLQKDLAKDQFQQAKSSLVKLKESFSQIKIQKDNNLQKNWEKIRTQLKTSLEQSVKSAEIGSLRKEFRFISEQMIKLEQQFGHLEGEHYLLFCPMAESGKGAFWLQNQKLVLNPYFGEKMLRCGIIQEIYKQENF